MYKTETNHRSLVIRTGLKSGTLTSEEEQLMLAAQQAAAPTLTPEQAQLLVAQLASAPLAHNHLPVQSSIDSSYISYYGTTGTSGNEISPSVLQGIRQPERVWIGQGGSDGQSGYWAFKAADGTLIAPHPGQV